MVDFYFVVFVRIERRCICVLRCTANLSDEGMAQQSRNVQKHLQDENLPCQTQFCSGTTKHSTPTHSTRYRGCLFPKSHFFLSETIRIRENIIEQTELVVLNAHQRVATASQSTSGRKSGRRTFLSD